MSLFPLLPDWIREVRLHPSAACRAWSDETGCLDAIEWEHHRDAYPEWRSGIESARLRISDSLSVDGIDPLGIFRKLLIHESTASESRSWIRCAGFVHLEAASGIHLYCAWNAFAALLRRIEGRGRLFQSTLSALRGLLPPILWLVVWSLSGFRPGLLRPLVLVGIRFWCERSGFRFMRGVPILAALGLDALLALLFSMGSERDFSEWAPGEAHYALSWWGGVLSWEFARKRGWSGIRSHFALSLGSWVAVLPLDLLEGRFSPATPFLSLLTVECLARGGYVLLLGLAIAIGMGGAGAEIGLQWASALANRGVGWIAEGVTAVGGVRFF